MSKEDNSDTIYIQKHSELFQNSSKNFSGDNETYNIFEQNRKKILIEASAGTGKTFTLVELVLELMLKRNIPLKSILIVTFTEKATTELKIRLRTKLREISDAYENKLSEFQNVPEKSCYYQSVADQKAVGFQKQIHAEFVYRIRVLCIPGQNQNPAMLP